MGSGAKGPYPPVIFSVVEGLGEGSIALEVAKKASFSQMHSSVERWARHMTEGMSRSQRSKFNTACIVVDVSTGAVYYGRNHGIERDHAKKNPVLFGDGTSKGLLPNPSLNHYSVGNCAEADAINKALNAGASLSNLQVMTIHTTKKGFGKLKCACENCTAAFKGNVAGNYSGWKW